MFARTVASWAWLAFAFAVGCAPARTPRVAPWPARAATPAPAETLVTELAWTSSADPRVLLADAETPILDVLPAAPESPAHPKGTVHVVTCVHHTATIFEWDVANARVIHARQLHGTARSTRAVRSAEQLLVLTETGDAHATHVRLTAFNARLQLLRDELLEIGPLPAAVSLAADDEHVVVAALVAGTKERFTVFSARTWKPTARLDAPSAPMLQPLQRQDSIALHGGQLYAVERDPAGALGLSQYEPTSLRRLAFVAAPDAPEDARAAVFAQESGLALLVGDTLTEYGPALEHPRSHTVKSLGSYVTRDASGKLLRAPLASLVVPVPNQPIEESCIPTWTPAALVLTCTTWSAQDPRRVYLTSQPPDRARALVVSR